MKAFKRTDTNVKLSSKALSKRDLGDMKSIYYPGMKNDLYTPFVALGATSVIASDTGDYYHPSWSHNDTKTAKFVKFADMLTEMRHEISTIGDETQVIVDQSNWCFVIKFRYNDRKCKLEYHLFIKPRDFKLDMVPDLVLVNEKLTEKLRKRARRKWRKNNTRVLLVNDKRSRVDVYSIKRVK